MVLEHHRSVPEGSRHKLVVDGRAVNPPRKYLIILIHVYRRAERNEHFAECLQGTVLYET